MASIYKRSADRRDKNKPYQIAFVDENGRRRFATGCTDRASSEEIARKLESDAKLRQRGIIDKSQERVVAQSRRAVGEHVEEFLEYVRARKPDAHAERYLVQVKSRLEALIDFAKVESLAELNSDRVAAFIANLQQKRLSGITINEYVGTMKSFTRWAAMTSRLANDPLAGMKKIDASRIEKKRPRRSLTAEEIGSLLASALVRPVRELRIIRTGANAGLLTAKIKPVVLARAERAGKERVLAYLLALWTGLRRSELRDLQWGDVRLDILPARIDLRAATTKAKRADSIALHPQVVEALGSYRPADAKPTDTILSRVPGMKALRGDLKLAGIAETTASGRIDLHAMRKSLGTYLSANAVPLRLAQAHLRHTDPRLTANVYTDERVLPVAVAISGLPWLPTEAPKEPESIRMTGTSDERGAQRLAQRTPLTMDQIGSQSCSGGGSKAKGGASSQPLQFARSCAAIHDNSRQRVKGLEPSTFTLAT